MTKLIASAAPRGTTRLEIMESTAALLSQRIGPLRRAILRATRAEAKLPDIPEAQVEILRALVVRSPQSPGELAETLRLAPSTVSNLTKSLAAAGLVVRSLAEKDSRSTELTLSAKAIQLLSSYDNAAELVLAAALGSFSLDEQKILSDAMPLMRRLDDVLTAGTLTSGH